MISFFMLFQKLIGCKIPFIEEETWLSIELK